MGSKSNNTSPTKFLRIHAVQTVTPAKATNPPGRSRPVRLPHEKLGREKSLSSRTCLILYYKGKEDAWLAAALMKETLNATLPDFPLFSGRLRKPAEVKEGEEGEKKVEGKEWDWELKMNDCGVRLVQGTAEIGLMELLELAAEQREEMESKLCYWADIDEESPHFCSPFYLQVTEFQGGGYSVGISCSLLLSDPFLLTQFIKSWSEAHNRMLASGHLSSSPLFHLSTFTNSGRPHHLSSTPLINSSPTSKASSKTTTILFKIPHNHVHATSKTNLNSLATFCLNEAMTRLDAQQVTKFTLIVNVRHGELRTETCNFEEEGKHSSQSSGYDGKLSVALWDEFGVNEIGFGEENKPVHVSYQIVSASSSDHEGIVVVAVPGKEEECGDLMISVTVPKKV